MASVHLHPILRAVDEKTIARWLPKRPVNTHKGDYGRLLLLCGAVGYTGAPALAATAALRTGAGLVFVGVPETAYPIVASKLTEPMVFPLPDENGMLSKDAVPAVLERLKKADACLIGCGLGQSEATAAVVRAVLEHATCPVVLDADGINVLDGHIDILRGAACPVILTPHEGEFLRLGGSLEKGRASGAVRLFQQTGATVLLKGHRTLICGDGGLYVNRCGNPGMATGGSGDVLAGIVVSMLGQGLNPTQAAAAAAWLHGKAGDLCAREIGQYGMLPTDLLKRLPRLLK
ncbi:MAG: NAD(P)H-hydrate dehydratase [Oscillospiraceae bacterium]|nr:NAD(P)H-hydrate dehydratase [Oscillospiraceae bacterium]